MPTRPPLAVVSSMLPCPPPTGSSPGEQPLLLLKRRVPSGFSRTRAPSELGQGVLSSARGTCCPPEWEPGSQEAGTMQNLPWVWQQGLGVAGQRRPGPASSVMGVTLSVVLWTAAARQLQT